VLASFLGIARRSKALSRMALVKRRLFTLLAASSLAVAMFFLIVPFFPAKYPSPGAPIIQITCRAGTIYINDWNVTVFREKSIPATRQSTSDWVVPGFHLYRGAFPTSFGSATFTETRALVIQQWIIVVAALLPPLGWIEARRRRRRAARGFPVERVSTPPIPPTDRPSP
jgi:hypothetical protein